jgi:hypothetical protein
MIATPEGRAPEERATMVSVMAPVYQSAILSR